MKKLLALVTNSLLSGSLEFPWPKPTPTTTTVKKNKIVVFRTTHPLFVLICLHSWLMVLICVHHRKTCSEVSAEGSAVKRFGRGSATLTCDSLQNRLDQHTLGTAKNWFQILAILPFMAILAIAAESQAYSIRFTRRRTAL
jgi:hypothetical protein